MIYYVINFVLFPRKINFSLITQFDVEVVWLIENKIKAKWAIEVIEYMMESKREEVCMSYGNLITHILEHIRHNFGDEEYKQEVTKIGKSVLPTMRF